MAISTRIADSQAQARPISRHNPLVLWHLLSLDAPTVAALWTWFLARANRIDLPLSSVLAMAVAVWLLYASDRLLDTRPSALHDPYVPPDLEERHYFHRSNLRAFTAAAVLASLALVALLPKLPPASIRLYLVLATLLLAWFGLIHTASLNRTHRLPKELAVGVFFSAATFIPTIARQPSLRIALLPSAILFAALCSLNCLFIYAWEHPTAASSIHPATRLALHFLPGVAIASGAFGLALSFFDPHIPWTIPAASAISAMLLLTLHHLRRNLAATTLRAAADLCLLTPILLLPFLPR